jgi:hypothetical protein
MQSNKIPVISASSKLASFLAQNGFLAYSLAEHQVENTLISGFLKSDERLLCETLTSVSLGSKPTLLEPIDKYIRDNNCRLSPCIKIISSETLDLNTALNLDLISEEELERCLETKLTESEIVKINDNVDLTKVDNKKVITTHNLLNVHAYPYGVEIRRGQADYPQQLSTLYSLFPVSSYYIQLANDLLIEEPVDVRLASVWQTLHKANSDTRLLSRLCKQRQNELYPGGALPQIRAHLNHASWSNGDVVVLFNLSNEFYSQLQPNPEEIHLRHPIENNGKPYQVDLKQVNALIIGPQNIIAKFAKAGFNTVALEELNEDELNLLKVPGRLRTKLVKTSAAVLSTLSVFTPGAMQAGLEGKVDLRRCSPP